MVGTMKTRHLSSNIVNQEKCSLKSIFYPKFESKLIENKYFLSYLTNIYPSCHRLLVLILIIHGFINLIELFLFKNKIDSKSKIIHLSLLLISILLNLLSLIIINKIKNIYLSNIISLICLFPLIILSCYYPFEFHIYILIILIYTLSNITFLLSLIISIIITLLILKIKINLILLLIINLIGIYLNRLLDITIRSSYNQLRKSKLLIN